MKTVLFDLDGTLLPMDQTVFTNAYFEKLAAKAAPFGYEPKRLIEGVWAGTAAMVKNDGSRTNYEAFWQTFSQFFGERIFADIPFFEQFYRAEFNEVRAVCGFEPAAAETVKMLQRGNVRCVLASNPLFPRCGQESRMRWAGLEIAAFSYITSYENSRYCKPNPDYYREILQKFGLKAEDCLMVGNDAREDVAAREAGIGVFLLTNCLLHAENFPLESVPHGDFSALQAYLKENILQ